MHIIVYFSNKSIYNYEINFFSDGYYLLTLLQLQIMNVGGIHFNSGTKYLDRSVQEKNIKTYLIINI
jgi:hypothetical protein